MFAFTPTALPTNIYVVGCGGTGSRLVPILVQFLRSITHSVNPRGWLPRPKIYLIDGDIVEEKNLLRQNFIQQDVGRNKAVVLAERYGRAFEMDVIAIPFFINIGKESEAYSPSAFSEDVSPFLEGRTFEAMRARGADEMVLMCVDSVKARKGVLDAFRSSLSPNQSGGVLKSFFIDAGNEDDFGQVRYFTNDILPATDFEDVSGVRKYVEDRLSSAPSMFIERIPLHIMPYDVRTYLNMQDGERTGSCADLDQTLAINAMMATMIMGIVQNYYYQVPMTFNEMSFSLQGANRVVNNTLDNILSRGVYKQDVSLFPNGVIFRGLSKEHLGMKFHSACKRTSAGSLCMEYLVGQKTAWDKVNAEAIQAEREAKEKEEEKARRKEAVLAARRARLQRAEAEAQVVTEASDETPRRRNRRPAVQPVEAEVVETETEVRVEASDDLRSFPEAV